jgi:hypothetical protein
VADFINSLVDWLPWTWLQELAEIMLYFAILGVMAIVPLLAWTGWAAASTRRDRD